MLGTLSCHPADVEEPGTWGVIIRCHQRWVGWKSPVQHNIYIYLDIDIDKYRLYNYIYINGGFNGQTIYKWFYIATFDYRRVTRRKMGK